MAFSQAMYFSPGKEYSSMSYILFIHTRNKHTGRTILSSFGEVVEKLSPTIQPDKVYKNVHGLPADLAGCIICTWLTIPPGKECGPRCCCGWRGGA